MKSTRQALSRVAILIMAVSLMACSSSGGDSATGTGGYGSVSLTGASALPSTYAPDLGLLTAPGDFDIITFTQAVSATRMIVMSVSIDPAGIITVMSDSNSATGGYSGWVVKNMGDEPTVNRASRTVIFANLPMVDASTGEPVTINGTLNYDIAPALVP